VRPGKHRGCGFRTGPVGSSGWSSSPSRLAAVLGVAMLGAAACTHADQAGEATAAQAREKRLEYRSGASLPKPLERAPVSEDGPPGPIQASAPPEELLAQIIIAAAELTGADPAFVEIRAAEQVTWADGSLGCPEPGVEYTLAPVPGFRIQVAAAGRLLDYRADMTGRFFLCDPGRLRKPGPAQ
jgi:hypothetical protein